MRALTIGVDAITGTAGLIWPGDRVDLILTLVLPDAAAPPGRRVAAETALTDVRVIAIDQQLVQGASPGSSDQTARTVTLEVNRDQAERVSVAMRLGRLSLAVRSADITHQAPEGHGQDGRGQDGHAQDGRGPTGTVWASDVADALSHDVTAPVQHAVKVFPGAADSKEFHF
jgi:pilus assembly protein CpaB